MESSFILVDQFKCGRVVFMKYQIKEGEIQEFIDVVTEEQVCKVCELCNENIPLISAQIWELPSVNRRATESDGKLLFHKMSKFS